MSGKATNDYIVMAHDWHLSTDLSSGLIIILVY